MSRLAWAPVQVLNPWCLTFQGKGTQDGVCIGPIADAKAVRCRASANGAMGQQRRVAALGAMSALSQPRRRSRVWGTTGGPLR